MVKKVVFSKIRGVSVSDVKGIDHIRVIVTRTVSLPTVVYTLTV